MSAVRSAISGTPWETPESKAVSLPASMLWRHQCSSFLEAGKIRVYHSRLYQKNRRKTRIDPRTIIDEGNWHDIGSIEAYEALKTAGALE